MVTSQSISGERTGDGDHSQRLVPIMQQRDDVEGMLHNPTFRSHVKDLLEKNHVPGIAIALVKNDKIASTGFGKASLKPPKECTPDTLFNIASASKSLTAINACAYSRSNHGTNRAI